MAAARTRFEVRVGTVVGKAALALFRLPERPTEIRRKTVYRLRVPTDRDVTDLLRVLTEHDVEVLEIRRCPAPRPPAHGSAGGRDDVAPATGSGGAVVVPFPVGGRPDRSGRTWDDSAG